ncbi:MAG: MerR family transcriptional regulator [Novosphingobium sp.]
MSGLPEPRFDDGKDASALRTIGEVSRALGIATHVLRYWEQQFPMLRPLKRSGGRRYYRNEDVALVETIDRLVNREGYTLRGARNALKGGAPAGDEPATDREDGVDVVARLSAIRSDLARALER